jgi:hypothetical protein
VPRVGFLSEGNAKAQNTGHRIQDTEYRRQGWYAFSLVTTDADKSG